MKRFLLAISLLFFSLPAAKAQIPGESWLTGENAIILKQLATQMSTLAEVENLVRGIRDVSGTLNEGLSIARQTYRQARAIGDFSLAEFVGQAEAALLHAFPDAHQIISDINDIENQFRLIEQGGTGFFRYRSGRDLQMNQLMKTYFSLGYQNLITKNVFRDPTQSALASKPTIAELEVYNRYKQTGALAKELMRKTAFATLAARADAMEQEIIEKEEQNLNDLMQASALKSDLRREEKLTEMVELIKLKLAEEWMEQDKTKKTRSWILKSIQEGIKKDIPLQQKEDQ